MKKNTDKLPINTFDMINDETIRKNSRQILKVVLFIQEIGFSVINYCSLNEETSKVLHMEMDNDIGIIDVKKTSDDELLQIIKYLEDRNIDIVSNEIIKYDSGFDVHRFSIKISSIGGSNIE